jgi:hypothetical protein
MEVIELLGLVKVIDTVLSALSSIIGLDSMGMDEFKSKRENEKLAM